MKQKGVKVLIVDDEPLIVEVLMAALKSEGYEVVGVNSGEEALEVFKKEHFDIVITDITMGKMSGIDLLFAVKEINKNVEVILITGYASLETAEAAIEGGAYRYIRKPFEDIQDILEIVEEAVKIQKQRKQKEKKFQEVVYQVEHLKKRVGNLETMYAISHIAGFPKNPEELIKNVVKLLKNIIPLKLIGCKIKKDNIFQIYVVTIKKVKDKVLNKFIELIHPNNKEKLEIKTIIIKDLIDNTNEIDKLEKLIEIKFPNNSLIEGKLLLDLPISYKLEQEEEELLEVSVAQIAGALGRLYEYLKEEKERLETFISNIKDGVIILKENEKIILVNTIAFNILEAKTKEEIKDKLKNIGVFNFIEDYKIKKTTLEKKVETKNGKYLSITLLPLTHPLEGTWFTVMIRDLTKEYILEKEIERSRRLSSIGELVSGVAHELNTPLTIILGYSQLLMGEKLPPSLIDDLDTICHEAQRCKKIIQNLLDLARSKPPEKIPVDVMDLIERVLELKQYDLKKNQIKVIKNFPKNSILIEVEPNKIQQVLLNIINNAQDAMSTSTKKELKINIKEDNKNKKAIIEIIDTGPGIPPKVIDRIFDPFFTTKPPGQGSGLGLSISYKIMKEHNGNIKVENSKQGGAIFILEFPLPEINEVENSYFKGLIIGSSQEMAEMLANFLKKYFIRCKISLNIQNTFKTLKDNKEIYDIIFLDYSSNKWSEILNILKEKYPTKTIIIHSENFSEETSKYIKNFQNIRKPFSLSDLEEKIEKIIHINKKI